MGAKWQSFGPSRKFIQSCGQIEIDASREKHARPLEDANIVPSHVVDAFSVGFSHREGPTAGAKLILVHVCQFFKNGFGNLMTTNLACSLKKFS